MAKVALLDHEKFDNAIRESDLKQEQLAEFCRFYVCFMDSKKVGEIECTRL